MKLFNVLNTAFFAIIPIPKGGLPGCSGIFWFVGSLIVLFIVAKFFLL